MKIGFDAKRAFCNFRGLGNYSRTLLEGLAKYYPDNGYFLYSPPIRTLSGKAWRTQFPKFNVVTPRMLIGKIFHGIWRSIYLSDVVKKDSLNIYHGLSHELPPYINELNIKTVVTIHDLLFERLPDYFSAIDRRVYRRKCSYSCQVANKIIAVSNQTKKDLVEFWNIPEEKVRVIYQSYSSCFDNVCTDQEKNEIKVRLQLPNDFILYVGALTANKNLIGLIKAYALAGVKEKLVIVGRGSRVYKAELSNLIDELNLGSKVIFLHGVETKELPAIYQQATCFAFPSFYEGFGIPVIEALASGIPVVTSKDTSMEEAGGGGAVYADPYSCEDIAEKLKNVLNNSLLRDELIKKGKEHAKLFSPERTARELMALYEELVSS